MKTLLVVLPPPKKGRFSPLVPYLWENYIHLINYTYFYIGTYLLFMLYTNYYKLHAKPCLLPAFFWNYIMRCLDNYFRCYSKKHIYEILGVVFAPISTFPIPLCEGLSCIVADERVNLGKAHTTLHPLPPFSSLTPSFCFVISIQTNFLYFPVPPPPPLLHRSALSVFPLFEF